MCCSPCYALALFFLFADSPRPCDARAILPNAHVRRLLPDRFASNSQDISSLSSFVKPLSSCYVQGYPISFHMQTILCILLGDWNCMKNTERISLVPEFSLPTNYHRLDIVDFSDIFAYCCLSLYSFLSSRTLVCPPTVSASSCLPALWSTAPFHLLSHITQRALLLS